MDPDLERVLRGLEEAAEWAKTYRFEMTDDYREMLARLEALPQNQSGSDKSHVGRAVRAYKNSFKNVRLLRDKP